MSHMGTRLVADWLADPTNGVAAVVALMTDVIDDGDTAPSGSLTVYDDTRHLAICSRLAELPDLVNDMQFPCLRVITASVDSDPQLTPFSDAQWVATGHVTVVVQLLLRDIEAPDSDGMYWLRAISGSLLLLNMATTTERTRCGVELGRGAISQGAIDTPLGDILISPGAKRIVVPFRETTPMSVS